MWPPQANVTMANDKVKSNPLKSVNESQLQKGLKYLPFLFYMKLEVNQKENFYSYLIQLDFFQNAFLL